MELRRSCLRDEDFTDQAPNLTILIEIYFSHIIVFEKCVPCHSVGALSFSSVSAVLLCPRRPFGLRAHVTLSQLFDCTIPS